MRKLSGILAVGALLLAGGTASAAPVQTTATITVILGPLGSFTVQGTGIVDVVGSGGEIMATTTGGAVITDATAIMVPAGIASLASVQTIPVDPNDTTAVEKIVLQPGVRQSTGTFVSNHMPGTVAGIAQTCPERACVEGGGKGGVMPIVGNVTVFVKLTPDGSPFQAPIALEDFNIGVGGNFTAMVIITAFGSGAPFTTGTNEVVTLNGNVTQGPAGSGAEPITFVSPVALDIRAADTSLPIFNSLSLSGIQMAPEPDGALLLAAGMGGLFLVAAWRRR